MVGVIIFLIEKATEKNKASKTPKRPQQPRKPAVAVSHQADEAALRAEAARHAALARRRSAARAAEEAIAAIKSEPVPVSPVLPEEGSRVTDDKPVREPARVRVSVPPVPGGDLRKAIIWSEILKRKF